MKSIKHVAFIDCFINNPVNHCVNSVTLAQKLCSTYHMPSVYGIDSLKADNNAHAYIILGSASHIYQKLDWHQELLNFIIPKIESGTPVLGLCFGHQLIANYYGCEIGYVHNDQKTLAVAREIQLELDFGSLKRGKRYTLGYAHAQFVSKISDKFEVLASSKEFLYEGLKHKNYPFYSFQAHPECSKEILESEINLKDSREICDILDNGQSIINAFFAETNNLFKLDY
jgi:GMP synthase (glutamine-hydrolysing)